MCFNVDADDDGSKQIQVLDQNWVDEAIEFLAYFALNDKPSSCAGQGTAKDLSPDLGSVRSTANWFTHIRHGISWAVLAL